MDNTIHINDSVPIEITKTNEILEQPTILSNSNVEKNRYAEQTPIEMANIRTAKTATSDELSVNNDTVELSTFPARFGSENIESDERSLSNLAAPVGDDKSKENDHTLAVPIDPYDTLDDDENEIREKQLPHNRITSSSDSQGEIVYAIQDNPSVDLIPTDPYVDKVYTIGCFDLFHEGHRILFQRMRQLGRTLIVGVHDSRSIYKLKSRVPVDGTETRMLNVKRHVDEVYCIAGTDPSTFVMCIVHLGDNETALYVRGDDMIDFPAREIVERLMPVKFLPYTKDVSSTSLRKEFFSHIEADDQQHLDNIN